jgi:hypothetical protein
MVDGERGASIHQRQLLDRAPTASYSECGDRTADAAVSGHPDLQSPAWSVLRVRSLVAWPSTLAAGWVPCLDMRRNTTRCRLRVEHGLLGWIPIMGRHTLANLAPIFVDPAGRRRRLLAGVGAGVGLVMVVAVAAIAAAVLGGGSAALPGLPTPARGHTPAIFHLAATSPPATPSSKPPTGGTAAASPTVTPSPGRTAPTPQPSPLPAASPTLAPSSTHPGNGRSPTTKPSHGPKN